MAGEQGGRIVVGVDGSGPSKAALAWAVRQAVLTGAEIDAVCAWQVPGAYGSGYGMTLAIPDLEKAAVSELSEAIAAVAEKVPEAEIRPLVVRDNPAQALLDCAKGADLLVVGSRGHGGFTGALLGSVGQHCAQHADCPVVIVRGPRPE